MPMIQVQDAREELLSKILELLKMYGAELKIICIDYREDTRIITPMINITPRTIKEIINLYRCTRAWIGFEW